MAEEFFIRFRGRTVGPYEVSQLQQMARKGRLSRATEVSSDGASWEPASSYPEIFQKPKAGDVAASSAFEDLGDPISSDNLGGFYSQSGTPSQSPSTAVSQSPQWYYTQGGAQLGPVPQETIVGLVSSGQLSASENVWRDGMPSWVPLEQVDAFRSAIIVPVVNVSQAARGGYQGGGQLSGFCQSCGTQVMASAFACHQCGTPVNGGGRSRGSQGGGDRISASNPPKDPALMGLLSGCCIMGLGQMMLGQVGKGVVILLGSIVLNVLTVGVASFVVLPLAGIDAYLIAKKLREGQAVGQWEFF